MAGCRRVPYTPGWDGRNGGDPLNVEAKEYIGCYLLNQLLDNIPENHMDLVSWPNSSP